MCERERDSSREKENNSVCERETKSEKKIED